MNIEGRIEDLIDIGDGWQRIKANQRYREAGNAGSKCHANMPVGAHDCERGKAKCEHSGHRPVGLQRHRDSSGYDADSRQHATDPREGDKHHRHEDQARLNGHPAKVHPACRSIHFGAEKRCRQHRNCHRDARTARPSPARCGSAVEQCQHRKADSQCTGIDTEIAHRRANDYHIQNTQNDGADRADDAERARFPYYGVE